MYKSLSLLFTICITQISFGQLVQEEIQRGYDYYNSKKNLISAERNLSSFTLNPNQIETVCFSMNRDYIIENFFSFKKSEKKIDAVFSQEQWANIERKFRSLESIKLERQKLKSEYKLRDSSYFKQSFPIIQKSKDSSLYAFIYVEAEFSSAYGIIAIDKKLEGNWESYGRVSIPLYDSDRLANKIVHLPEEYQVINSYLAGKEDYVLNTFVPGHRESLIGNRLKDFEAWNAMGRSIFEDRVNVKEHFEKRNLVDIVENFIESKSGTIRQSMILGDLKCVTENSFSGDNKAGDIYSFSKPFIFISNITCETYAVFYVSSFGGPLNGSGHLVVMHKKDGLFQTLISHMLWIS